MEKVELLGPEQLIAMIDYPPLHSPEAFFTYIKKIKSGEHVEPIVVVPKKIVIEYLAKHEERRASYQKTLEQFLLDHPKAEYFMLGGKHRSAAATLLGQKIKSIIVRNDEDVDAVNSLRAKGELTGVPDVERDLKETLRELEEHYFEHKRFWTMDEKTNEMIKNGDIPKNFL